MNNVTAGKIKLTRALELARSVFPNTPEGTLKQILWHKAGYPFQDDERKMLADLREWKRACDERVASDG